MGVGKSSLINLLGIRIKNQNETIKMNKSLYQKITKKLFGERNNVKMKLEHTVKVIHIDASQYDDREKLWAGISIELYKAYIKENKYLGYIKLACKQINKLDYLYVLFLDLILVGLYVLSEYVFGISKGIFTNRIILTASGYLVILLSYWIENLIGLVKKSRDKKPMNKHVEKLGYKMRVTEEIKMLTKLLQGSKWFSKKNTKFLNRRIVIVIDELDRSNHEKILEAVEAIQLLVDMEDLITILSLNFEIACNVIGKRQAENKGIYDNEVFFKLGKSFLEKYVSLPIYLDSPTSYDEFIISMIEVTIKEEENGEEKGEEKREENTSVDINLNLKMEEILGRVEEKKKFKPDLNLFNEEEREKMIEVTKDIIRISPELINGRGIKRLINILIVLKSLLDYEQIYISFINVIEFVVYLYVLENNIDIKFEEKIKLVNKFIKIESKIFKDDGLTDRTKIIELIRIFFYKSEYLKYEELKEIGQGY